MSSLPRTDAVVGKPRPHILALCCELERELRESTDYAEACTAALCQLIKEADDCTAALIENNPHIDPQELRMPDSDGISMARAALGREYEICHSCAGSGEMDVQAIVPGTADQSEAMTVACVRCGGTGDFKCCGASDKPCPSFEASCENPANYPKRGHAVGTGFNRYCSRHSTGWNSPPGPALCPVCQDDRDRGGKVAHHDYTAQERLDDDGQQPDTPRTNYASSCGTSALRVEAAKMERELRGCHSQGIVQSDPDAVCSRCHMEHWGLKPGHICGVALPSGGQCEGILVAHYSNPSHAQGQRNE